MRNPSLILFILFIAISAFAQEKKEVSNWDVEKYKGTSKTFTINTSEGYDDE